MTDPTAPGEHPQPRPHGAESSRPRPHGAESSRPRPHGAESSRPRPRYGEYATPEEQRARIRQPEVSALSEAGVMPVPATVPSSRPTAAPSPAPVKKTRLVDRILTIVMLAWGLFGLLTAIPAYADYQAYAQYLFDFVGAEGIALSDPVGARGWGLAAALVLGLGWLLTAVISWRSLRAGRITFWIPIVGAVVFQVTAAILLMVPIANDPVVWPALQSVMLGGASG